MKERLNYLPDKPAGIDITNGKSQERLAAAISKHIIETDSKDKEGALSRIIGIEGTWGSGKSNVVRMVEKELESHSKDKSQYHFFPYNAWGNQEDLMRRSFMEQLTGVLSPEIISSEPEVEIRGEKIEGKSWNEILKILLSRTTEINSKITPPLIGISIIIAFLAVLMPIANTYASFLTDKTVLKYVLPAIPVILACIIWLCLAIVNNKYFSRENVAEMLTGKVYSENKANTVSEYEPTVTDFKNWMHSISDNLKQKLVIVFDDMDRLPADKVKQLWSSIHTFFAQETYEKIWVIIPYDRETIDCVFGGEENAEDESDRARPNMSQYFINKTFSITFRVPKPIITDYEGVFSSFFEKAFEESDDPKLLREQESVISQLYRQKNREPNIRNIIIFINELVTLRKMWGEEYSIVNMAIYLLNKSGLEKDPMETILSKKFNDDFNGLIKRDDDLLNEISSFVYGVDKSSSLQIPMKRYIENCIDGVEGYDINAYSGKKDFDAILNEVYADINTALLPKMVDILNELKKSNESISGTWKNIADRIINERIDTIFNLAVTPSFLNLLSHVTDRTKNDLVETWSSFAEHSGDNFKGADYVKSIIKLKEVLGDSITIPLPVIKVSAEQFIEALKVANEDYPKYNLSVPAVYVEDTFIRDPNLGFNRFDLVRILKDTGFCEFKDLKSNIIGYIRGNEVDAGNVGGIYNTYRILSEPGSGTLVSLNSDVVMGIKKSLEMAGLTEEGDGYLDVLAMTAVQFPYNFQAPTEKLHDVARIIEYYINADTLLLTGSRGCSSDYKKLVRFVVTFGFGKKMNSMFAVLQHYSMVKNFYGLTTQELLGYLNKWSDEFVSHINVNEGDIKKTIRDENFYKDIDLVDNDLTKAVKQYLKK